MTVRTCTKVNVGLNVMRRRPDGYHDIETLFVPYYGFGDLLTVEPAKNLTIHIEREGGVDWDPMEDLTIRAWRLLKADFPELPEVTIHLEKHAPVGAGLGGGSADAAFMLRAMNSIAALGLDDAALASYAARLGSDCAFFIYCRPMFATGRGEILEPFDIDLSAYELQVEIPVGPSGAPVAVSTREAYSGIIPRDQWTSAGGVGGCPGTAAARELWGSAGGWGDGPGTVAARGHVNGRGPRLCVGGLSEAKSNGPSPQPPADGHMPLREALSLPVERWSGLVINDFEASVCPAHPEITELIQDFYRRGASYAAMSGSGSSVFGLFRK